MVSGKRIRGEEGRANEPVMRVMILSNAISEVCFLIFLFLLAVFHFFLLGLSLLPSPFRSA